MWTNGVLVSPIRPEILRMPDNSRKYSQDISDQDLKKAGWYQIPYNEEVFLTRTVNW